MNKIINILLLTSLALCMGSCASEAPFQAGDAGNGYGKVLTSSLAVQVQDVQTRAENVDVSNFKVNFFNTDNTTTPVLTYTYKDMPEIVILPAGADYKVVADFGENPSQDWDSPYYYGESNEFTVSVDKIVDNLDPIKCKLSNVKVSINFDTQLVNAMSQDSKVTVKVGESGSLDFTKETTKSGYFAYVEGSTTLTATFSGKIDEVDTNETKTYNDVKPGTHYKITFRIHKPDPTGTGNVTTGDDEENSIAVDAAVEITELGGDNGFDITPDEEILLDDESERPSEDPIENPTPDNPEDPNTPSQPGPTITSVAPIDLDVVNDVDASSKVILNIQSPTGITGFTVDVESKTLDLGDIGLSNHLDLVNPEATLGALQGLGLLNDDTDPNAPPLETLAGLKEKKFDISGFMPLLSPAFAGRHDFRLIVTDGEGSREVVLQINVK